MKTFSILATRLAVFLALGMLAALASGCIVGGGYGYYDDGYAPYGDYYGGDLFVGGVEHHREHDYRGWGPGYHVAPYRHGAEHGGFGHGGAMHNFRSAPASHSMPSLPSRSFGGRR
jgi:hypothetical protein